MGAIRAYVLSKRYSWREQKCIQCGQLIRTSNLVIAKTTRYGTNRYCESCAIELNLLDKTDADRIKLKHVPYD